MAVVFSIVPYPFLPAKIGGQKGIALFNKYFARHQKLICATVNSNKNELAEGYEAINVFSVSRLRYINPIYFFKLRKLIRQRKATHLLLEHPYYGWLALLLTWFTSVRLIVHSHNIESARFKALGKWWWRILWHYEKLIHRQADYNLFIQEADKAYAIRHFGLAAEKCIVATYGIEWDMPPSQQEIQNARDLIRKKHNIPAEQNILLFVGSFGYEPNWNAFLTIRDKVCPLLHRMNFPFKVLICGPGLPSGIASDPSIIITGFVDDIAVYFKAATVFINPVQEGGGIKTKLVEAIGYNINAVSTDEGAIGIDPCLTKSKLLITANNDWEAFVTAIEKAVRHASNTPKEYYQHFYWDSITKRVGEFIERA